MKRNTWGMTAAAGILAWYVVTAAAAGRGLENIDIYGGQSGKVPFSHVRHQDRLSDCNVCHSVFPQATQAIQRMKEQGTLTPKKVMNLQCIKCHRDEKNAGNPHGPLTCSTCHVR